jgi:hypothetical protein
MDKIGPLAYTIWSDGVVEQIKFRNADCGFKRSGRLIYQSAIRNLKSAIYLLHHSG